MKGKLLHRLRLSGKRKAYYLAYLFPNFLQYPSLQKDNLMPYKIGKRMSDVMGFCYTGNPPCPHVSCGLRATNHSSGINDLPLAWLESIPGSPMVSLCDLGQISLVYRPYSEE